MWWLYHDKLSISTNFTKVSNNKAVSPQDLHSAGISIVNFEYSSIFWDEIRFANISVQFASVKTMCENNFLPLYSEITFLCIVLSLPIVKYFSQ